MTSFLLRKKASMRSLYAIFRLLRSRNIGRVKKQIPSTGAVALAFSIPSFFSFSNKSNSEVKSGDQPISAENPISQIDALLKLGQYGSCVEKLKALLMEDETNFEATWRLAYAVWCHGRDQLPTSPEQVKLYNEALAYAQLTYQMNPHHAKSHKMMGICLTEAKVGFTQKFTNPQKIFNHLKTACELEPNDPESHYFFGSVCFVSCVIPSALKTFTSLMVSLPKSTFEEALHHFETAEKLQPNFMCRNHIAMAKTYARVNKFEEAAHWIMKASEFPAITPKDSRDREDARKILSKWRTQDSFKNILK